jgi:hypothetical protein
MISKKKVYYMGWWSDKPLSEATRDAIKRYTEKYGSLPTTILLPPNTDLKPMEGMNYVIRTDPYVLIETMLLGEIEYEKEICLDRDTEQE